MAAEQGLFSPELISPEVSAALPDGYRLRPLRRTDREGFLDCLRVLTTVGDISETDFEERYNWLAKQEGSYYILVVEDTNVGKVVGTGALIAERKL
jgi:glucosamine-phosphate N-acetyltransferase